MRRNRWLKSSFSDAGGSDCVEVRITDSAVNVRDTKNRDAGMLHFSSAAWTALTSGLVERDTH